MDNLKKLFKKERKYLDSVSDSYNDDTSQGRAMKSLVVKTFEPYLNNKGKGLELGCSNGYMTEILSKKINRLDVIDGSKKFLAETEKRNLPNVRCKHSLFEEYKLNNKKEKYDYVFACYILEHVLNTKLVLRMVQSVLKPTGLFFVVVPNGRALSRQLALEMKLINNLYTLTKNDKAHGHRRVYDRHLLNRDLNKCGFKTISEGGIMLKFLADFQMDRLFKDGILSDSHVEGLYKLGLQYPDLASALFSICKVE